MKASNRRATWSAALTLAASGACIADVGMQDGKDMFTDFQSGKTRAQVHQEYVDAKAQGLLPRGDADRWTPDSSGMDIGARGPAGSRYQQRTREEVRDELRLYRRNHNPYDTNDIYFGS